MIQLKIGKEQAEGGASRFRIEPAHISLGSMGANGVDRLAVSLPEEWQGMTVRLTFVPCSGEAVAVVLDDSDACTLTGDITGADSSGQLIADAVGKDGYVAYSAACAYTAEPHAAAGGKAPSYTQDEYQQFITAVQGYSETASAARQQTAQMAQAVAQASAEIGCRSFALNEAGSLIETAVYTTADGTHTETTDLGIVSAYGQAKKHGFTGTEAQWLAGLKGEKGDTGAQGPKGDTGEKGDTGAQGPKGDTGEKGDTGAQGPKGDTGEKGDTGAGLVLLGRYATAEELLAAQPIGAAGQAWAIGTAEVNHTYIWDTQTAAWTDIGGMRGPAGEKGDTGAQGEKGDPGEKGEKGDAGAQGAKGDPGEKGEKGDTGAQGAKGDPGEKGEKGDTGAQGAKGDPGEKGEKGDTGAQGAKGDPGEKGEKGDMGAAGTDGKSAYQAACENGYTSTEAAFGQFLAQGKAQITALQQAAAAAFSMQMVWINDSPSASFAAQTVDLDLSGCAAVYIVPLYNNKSICIYPGTLAMLDTDGRLVAAQTSTYYRAFSVAESGVTFSAASSGDTVCIPYCIFAIKGM